MLGSSVRNEFRVLMVKVAFGFTIYLFAISAVVMVLVASFQLFKDQSNVIYASLGIVLELFLAMIATILGYSIWYNKLENTNSRRENRVKNIFSLLKK